MVAFLGLRTEVWLLAAWLFDSDSGMVSSMVRGDCQCSSISSVKSVLASRSELS